MSKMQDERRHRRHTLPGKVKVHWRTPDGHSFHEPAKCLNISRSGIRVALPRAIAVGTLVHVESPQFRIAGVAYVRNCVVKGAHYLIGIEFGGGLQWTEPE